MKNDSIRLVQMSWRRIVPIADTTAELFFQRLFELDPTLRPRFAMTDMASQRKQMMRVLAKIVNGLQDLDALIPEIEALARRYADFGLGARHYDAVAEALFWALEQGLGTDWNSATRKAWLVAWELVADSMKCAANDHLAASLAWQPVQAQGIAA